MRPIAIASIVSIVSICLAAACPAQDAPFLRADANIDREIDISDPVFTLVQLFLGAGAEPPCRDAMDANGDLQVDIADPIFTLGFLFLENPPPPLPFPEPGYPPEGRIGCQRYGDADPRGIIADHTRTELEGISVDWVDAAKDGFRVYYGHTSHGSQILSGMSAMRDAVFDYNRGAGTLQIAEVGGDLGNPDFVTWAATTRSQLQKGDNDRNVVMWSWCGQASWASEENIRRDYLGNMDALEKEFPGVKFIYMTGHLDGSGVDGDLNERNEQIRAFCKENAKILFDFADIESYDPDGNYYLDKEANDNCDYRLDGVGRNWAQEWCAAHPGECSSCSCAHSQSLNCDRKARAFWWLLSRMAAPEIP